MRLILLLFLGLCVVQLNSCASQNDSTHNEVLPRIENTKKANKSGEIKQKFKEINAPTVDDEKGLSEEEAEMGMSVITYENVIEKLKDAKEEESPASSRASDLPVQGQKVKLGIQNNHSFAMWYLMPAAGEKAMPDDGKFAVNPEADPPFVAKKFGQNGAHLVELIYHGKDGQSFRAFYVEAGSSLLFRNYDLGTYREGDYVPFWSARELDVNNTATLEEWLPFSVKSSPNIVMHNTTESGPAKWVDLGDEVDFPKDKVQFIQAGSIKRYQIPVGVVR